LVATLTFGVALPASAEARKRLAVFAYDEAIDAIIRVEDLNDDGDTLDAGEVTNYAAGLLVDDARGLYALTRREVLATNSFPPDRIVRLADANDDGDAFDPGEATDYHNGALPNGYSLTYPASLTRTPDGAFFVVDNNTRDTANPEAAYKLVDRDSDGDLNDPNEVMLFWEFSPAGASNTSVLELEAGPGDALFAFDASPSNVRIFRVAPDGSGAATFATASTVRTISNFTLSSTQTAMSYDRNRGRMLFGATTIGGSYIVSLLDRNGNNVIDVPNEVREVWIEAASPFNTGTPRDIFWLPDNRVLWVDALYDRLWLLTDWNDDADYFDADETTYIYDAAEAAAAGQPWAPQLLSVAAVQYCIADLDGDGAIAVGDLSLLLANFGTVSGATPSDGDLNGDGAVDLEDLSLLLADFGQPCDD